MKLPKVSIEDLHLQGKRVIIRADFNVPLDESGHITDDTRIRGTLPTINYAVDEGARVILCSHLGRPNGKVDPRYSLAPVARRLQRLLGKEVGFAEDCVGAQAETLVNKMKPGDVLLLENLRFHEGEESNDEHFAKALAKLAEVYVNDAFGAAHRSHASIVGITKFLPEAGAGFLMRKEIEYLEGAVANPVRPFAAILGGAKVSGKIGVIENLGKKVDKVLIGGGMAFTYLKAQGLEVGNSIVEDGMLSFAREYTPAHVLAAVRSGEPIAAPVQHRMPSSQWRRYDKMRRFPAGLLVCGDAICSFNPVYGQGMSVAALDAVALRDCLRRGMTDLPRRYFRAAAKPIGVAWQLAAGSDLAFPEVEGPRTPAIRVTNRFVDWVLTAAESDAGVGGQFFRVTTLLDPPTRLLNPLFISRVATVNLLRRQRNSQPRQSELAS